MRVSGVDAGRPLINASVLHLMVFAVPIFVFGLWRKQKDHHIQTIHYYPHIVTVWNDISV